MDNLGLFLTQEEIKQQFNSEWVLLGDTRTAEDLSVIGGIVLWHSKDRDEVYRKAREIKPHRFAFLFTGSLPENTAIVL